MLRMLLCAGYVFFTVQIRTFFNELNLWGFFLFVVEKHLDLLIQYFMIILCPKSSLIWLWNCPSFILVFVWPFCWCCRAVIVTRSWLRIKVKGSKLCHRASGYNLIFFIHIALILTRLHSDSNCKSICYNWSSFDYLTIPLLLENYTVTHKSSEWECCVLWRFIVLVCILFCFVCIFLLGSEFGVLIYVAFFFSLYFVISLVYLLLSLMYCKGPSRDGHCNLA